MYDENIPYILEGKRIAGRKYNKYNKYNDLQPIFKLTPLSPYVKKNNIFQAGDSPYVRHGNTFYLFNFTAKAEAREV